MKNPTITITNVGSRQFTYSIKIPNDVGFTLQSGHAYVGEEIEIPTDDNEKVEEEITSADGQETV